MGAIGHKFLDIPDFESGTLKNGEVADIINMMAETNSVLLDAIARPANQGATHLNSIMAGLPDVIWGKMYQGIPNSKSKRTTVTDVTGFVEGRSQVDARFAEVEKNFKEFRLQEAQGFLESLGQEHARALFYEDADSNPEKITGFAPRFSDPTAGNGSQIVDGGGRGSDNTSIWFVTWATNACHLIYPETSQAGIVREDHGKQRVTDDSGDAYYAYEETFRLHSGLVVRDWRKVVRIANIDVSDAQAGSTDLFRLLISAFYRIKGKRTLDTGTTPGGMDGNFVAGNTVIYMNSQMLEALDAQQIGSGNASSLVRLMPREVEGKEVLAFRGIPIRQVDQLVNTEAAIPFA